MVAHVRARSQPARHARRAARRRQRGARRAAAAAQPLGDEPGAGAAARDDRRSAAGPGRARPRADAARARAARAGRPAGAGRARRCCARPRSSTSRRLVRTFTLRTSDGFVETFGPALIARVGRGGARRAAALRAEAGQGQHAAARRHRRSRDRRGRAGRSGPEVRAQALFRDRFIGVVRTGHPLRQGEITPARYAAGRHIHRLAARPRARVRSTRRLQALGLKRDIATIVGGFCDRAGAGAGVRPDRHRARAAHRDSCAPACTAFALPFAAAGDHGLAALAPAARRRSGASLAARLRPRRLRGLTREPAHSASSSQASSAATKTLRPSIHTPRTSRSSDSATMSAAAPWREMAEPLRLPGGLAG